MLFWVSKSLAFTIFPKCYARRYLRNSVDLPVNAVVQQLHDLFYCFIASVPTDKGLSNHTRNVMTLQA